jgi:hypothetical protein
LLLKAMNQTQSGLQQHPNASMRALNSTGSNLETFEAHRHAESQQDIQARQYDTAPSANIISGTYINSSIIVHNPGVQAILVP